MYEMQLWTTIADRKIILRSVYDEHNILDTSKLERSM